MTALAQPFRPAARSLLNAYVLLVLLVMLAPALALVPLSFSGAQSLMLPPKSYSFHWYHNLLSDPGWRSSLFLSLKVASLVAFVNALIGTMAAVGLTRAGGRMARMLRIAFLAP